MTILPGPLDKLYNSSKQGALLEEYTIYLKENGQIFFNVKSADKMFYNYRNKKG